MFSIAESVLYTPKVDPILTDPVIAGLHSARGCRVPYDAVWLLAHLRAFSDGDSAPICGNSSRIDPGFCYDFHDRSAIRSFCTGKSG
jgi:hypothetical protein